MATFLDQDRRLIDVLASERRDRRISQCEMAQRIQTSQASLAVMELGQRDPRITTLERYAAGLGKKIIYQLVDA